MIDFNGTWRSNGGSELTLQADAITGLLSGQYKTVHGRAAPDEIYPITGFINDEMIGWVCAWGKHKSVSTWCGRWTKDAEDCECLNVVWHLGRQFADEAQTQPNLLTFTFHTNAGKFFKVTTE